MATKKNRKAERAEVALVARYRSPTAFEFVAEDCADLSAGGMFIRSPKPAPPGTLLKLECEVGDGKATIRAVARVVWLREQETSGGPIGMGVKFVKLEPGSKEVIQAVLENPGLRQSLIPGSRVLSPAAIEQGAIRSSVSPPERASAAAPSTPPPSAAASAFGAARESRPVEQADAESFGFGGETARATSEPAAAVEPIAVAEPVLASSPVSESEPAAAAPSVASEPPPPAETAIAEVPAASAAPSTPPEAPRSEPPGAAEPSSVHVVRRKSGAEGLRERLKQSKLFDDLQRRPSTSPPAELEPASASGTQGSVETASAGADAAPAETAPAYTPARYSEAEPAPKVERAAGAERLFIPTADDAEAAAADERLDSLPPDVPPRERVSKRTKIIIAAVAGWGVLIAVFATRDVAPPEEIAAPPAAEAAKPPAPPALTPPPAPEEPLLPATPVPGLTPTEPAPPAEAVEAEPAPPPPSALPVEYVLDVVTIPPGARVSAGGQTVTTPGQLRLGLLEAPVQIAASKQGFVRVVSTIDRREFQPQGDEMRGTLTLALVEEGASSSTKADTAPAPAPERPKAAVKRPRPPAPAPAPAPPPEPAPVSDGVRTAIATTKGPKATAAGPAPMETALACLSRGDNECVIAALDGKANTPRELELLIETYRATGRSAKAETLMENYVRRFPDQRRSQSYQRMLDTQ